MSVFGSIMSAIFGSRGSGAQAAQAGSTAQSAPSTASSGNAGTQGASATAQSTAGTAAGAGSGGSVDVAAVVEQRAKQKGEKLDWRHSIVDLMKALDLDSSLSARKALAQELHYTGDMNDSAAMNMWLHKQVMQKLAENGGSVPQELRG